MQPHQEIAIVLLQPLAPGPLPQPTARSADLGQDGVATDLRGLGEAHLAGRYGRLGRLLCLAGGLAGERGDALGEAGL